MNTEQNLSIFIVDDDIFSLAVYEQHLQNLGYKNITTFLNGTDCLNNITKNPDVIFLDHDMGDLNGFEVLKKIKRHNPDAFVVMVSGQENVSVAVDSMKYGAFDYIVKGEAEEDKITSVLIRIASLQLQMYQKQAKGWRKMLPFMLWFWGVILITNLSSCTQNIFQQSKAERKAQQAFLDSAFAYKPDYQYRIRKDDKVTFSVWGQEELSVGSVYGIYNSNEVYGKWLLVDAKGKISVPKVGEMKVEGMTIPQLKDTLRSTFKKWVVNPVIDAKILNKEITILGEVRNPAVLQVDKDHNSLLEMVAKTGGFEFYANLKYVKILRQEGANVRVANLNLTKAGDYLSKNIQLHPGDVVIVPSKGHKVFDKRISVIIPFATTLTAIAIFQSIFK